MKQDIQSVRDFLNSNGGQDISHWGRVFLADVYGYLIISDQELNQLKAGGQIDKNGYALTFDREYEVPFSNGKKSNFPLLYERMGFRQLLYRV